MRIAELAVERHQFTIVVFVGLIALGVSSFLAIPRAEDPQFPIARFAVVAVYPGASPRELEELVVDPLEDKLDELDDVKAIKTAIEDSLAVIDVEFNVGVDVDRKYDEVVREVNATRPDLPESLAAIEIRKFNTTNVAILQLALVSADAPYRELQRHAERLEDRLDGVPGVKDVASWGFPEQQVKVTLDPAKLAQTKLPLERVLSVLAGANATIPGGSVDMGRRKLNVQTSGAFASLDEVAGTVLAGSGHSLLRVGDVARVAWGYEDASYITRFNGQRAVFVTVQQKAGQNIFDVRRDLEREIASFAKTLPASVRLELGFDQSKNVEHRLGGLTRDFTIAILLVLVTLLPLGLRASLIVMVSIPLSLAMGVTLLHFAGFSINQLSIVGFVIALGLLVDDSIVVTENVTRFLREGKSRKQAAVEATKQIGVAVIGCTATLVFSFLPLLFLPGVAGEYIRSMPLAVLFTVLASLIVSLTIIPFLASRTLREHDAGENRAYRLFHLAIEASYRRVLRAAMARPKATLVVAALLFVASLGLVPAIGFSLFPKAGIPQFLVRVETPDGSSLGETDAAVRFVETTLGGHPEVASVMSNVGGGNPQVYYNVARREERTNIGEVLAQLDHFDPVASPLLLDQLRRELAAYPNAKLEVREFENGPPIDAPVAIRILSDDLPALAKLSAEVAALIESVPGTTYVNDPLAVAKTDIAVRIDRARAGMAGVSELAFERSVRMAVAGLPASRYRTDEGDEYDIMVTLPRTGRQTIRSLESVGLISDRGADVPLRQIATVALEASPSSIQHYGKQRSVTVTAYTKTGFNTDRVTKQVIAALEAMRWPEGSRYLVAGELESRSESFGGLSTAILIAAFAVLAVLVLEFKTFKSTLIVASVIPLGIVGGLIALFVSGNTLSFTAVVGFVALIGIEVKNSILLVDFTNQLRRDGVAMEEAIEQAGEVRFFPILLTTLTALGGLIPLVLEHSSLYSPLALVIMGGLISSTLLARLVTPVMYKLLAPAL